MPPNSRVFASPMLAPPEKQKLAADLAAILDARGVRLADGVRDALLEELGHAVGRAKAGPDLETAAELDRIGLDWAHDRIFGNRSRRKPVPAPDINRRKGKPLQTPPAGRGRPANTAQDLLMRDVRQALGAAGLPKGFKTGYETLLTEVVRACAGVARLHLPDDLKNIWDNTTDINDLTGP